MNPPENLPPLPPVPPGFDRLVYRGVAVKGLETYYWLDCRVKDWHKGGHVSCGCPETHYLEAVREPAKEPAAGEAEDWTFCPECQDWQACKYGGGCENHGNGKEGDTTVEPTGVEARVCGWRPIETAPKDGMPILVWNGKVPVAARWGYSSDGDYNNPRWEPLFAGALWRDSVTHWQPLPPPPAERSDHE